MWLTLILRLTVVNEINLPACQQGVWWLLSCCNHLSQWSLCSNASLGHVKDQVYKFLLTRFTYIVWNNKKKKKGGPGGIWLESYINWCLIYRLFYNIDYSVCGESLQDLCSKLLSLFHDEIHIYIFNFFFCAFRIGNTV